MFSGKTATLITELRAAAESGLKTAAFKPAVDVRASPSSLVTHSGVSWPCTVVNTPAELFEPSAAVDVVGIDEAQFFDASLADVVKDLAIAGTRVLVAALDLDFRALPFPSSEWLSEVADGTSRLTATCGRCGKEATLTQRYVDGVPASLDDCVIRVGSHGLYEPRCRSCWLAERRARP